MDSCESEAVAEVIHSGWVTQGPKVKAFEEKFAHYVGASHACAVSSCTAALHLALKATGVKTGDEVITVSHTFIATANAVRYTGAEPVFIDIEPYSYNMDPNRIKGAITDKTRAVLCVHQMGMPCDITAIKKIAGKFDLPVIEDAACAVGSEIKMSGEWQHIGRPHSDIACFSFHPRKIITTGDGGMLTTNSELYDRKFRLWRQHAMSVPDTARHNAGSIIFESYSELGYNYRMTDIQAAVGIEQMKKLPSIINQRRALARRYYELLHDVPDLILPMAPKWARSNWQSYCVRLPNYVSQKQVMQAMLDAGVATRRGITCIHLEPAYRSVWSSYIATHEDAGETLAESEHALRHALILPLYPAMTAEEQEYISTTLRQVLARFR
jgi:dTDP-4-amino-4,6-dideoxygalactose transaminase